MAKTIAVSSVFQKVRFILQDTGATKRWSDEELVEWLNLGCKETVSLKLSTNPVTTIHPLQAGTRQAITGFGFIYAVRNMGDGTEPGKAIIMVPRDRLDTLLPNWHADPPSDEVRYVAIDPVDPKSFFVYPPQPPGTTEHIEILEAKAPEEISTDADLATEILPLDDIYEGALVDYICYRAFLKDSAHDGSAARAVAHYGAFATALGAKAANEGMQQSEGAAKK